MELTEEQKERIKKNRERALAIQKRRKEEAAAALSNSTGGDKAKRQKLEDESNQKDEKDMELEDFELGASQYVTKKEATQTYCLPEGTLQVCGFVEKENPHHKKWAPLKLYSRKEIRRRARERFGGLDGLQAERKKRAEKQFLKDMEVAKNVFKK